VSGVDVRADGATRVVTLRWQEKKNSLGPQEARAITAAIDSVRADPDARALVLTGEGAFCSGGDLRTFAELSAALTVDEVRTRVYGDIQPMVLRLRDIPIPTIAAVDGPAVGLGMDLALACDMRFIGPAGWLQQGWGRAGLIAATAGSWFVEQARPGLLWDLLADQPRLDGAACERLRLGQPGEPDALSAALARGQALAKVPSDTMAAYLDLNRRQRWPEPDYFDRCSAYQAGFIGSERFRVLAGSLLSGSKG